MNINEVQFNIVNANGYYDVYADGMFFCSVDTYEEGLKEIEHYKKIIDAITVKE